MNYLFNLFLFLNIFFEIFAQYLFKLSYNKHKLDTILSNKNSLWLPFISHLSKYIVIIGIIFYSIVGFLSYKLLNYASIGVINIIWHLIHFFALFLIGILFFDEQFTTKKTIAIILGFISLFLLNDEISHH